VEYNKIRIQRKINKLERKKLSTEANNSLFREQKNTNTDVTKTLF